MRPKEEDSLADGQGQGNVPSLSVDAGALKNAHLALVMALDLEREGVLASPFHLSWGGRPESRPERQPPRQSRETRDGYAVALVPCHLSRTVLFSAV